MERDTNRDRDKGTVRVTGKKDRGTGQSDKDRGTGTVGQEDRERDTEIGEGQIHKDAGTGIRKEV